MKKNFFFSRMRLDLKLCRHNPLSKKSALGQDFRPKLLLDQKLSSVMLTLFWGSFVHGMHYWLGWQDARASDHRCIKFGTYNFAPYIFIYLILKCTYVNNTENTDQSNFSQITLSAGAAPNSLECCASSIGGLSMVSILLYSQWIHLAHPLHLYGPMGCVPGMISFFVCLHNFACCLLLCHDGDHFYYQPLTPWCLWHHK